MAYLTSLWIVLKDLRFRGCLRLRPPSWLPRIFKLYGNFVLGFLPLIKSCFAGIWHPLLAIMPEFEKNQTTYTWILRFSGQIVICLSTAIFFAFNTAYNVYDYGTTHNRRKHRRPRCYDPLVVYQAVYYNI